MQSVTSRIWTHVAVSISSDNNHYTMGTSFISIYQSIYLVNGAVLRKWALQYKYAETNKLSWYWEVISKQVYFYCCEFDPHLVLHTCYLVPEKSLLGK